MSTVYPPPPWRWKCDLAAGADHAMLVSDNGEVVIQTTHDVDASTRVAKMIAAAPLLLDALDAARNGLLASSNGCLTVRDEGDLCAEIDAALRAAGRIP